jgi:sugar phosphate permease
VNGNPSGQAQRLITNAIERSAMRKTYLRLLPLAVVSYLLAYIDRINVSFAGLTMRDDLKTSAGAFGFALGTFYRGYSIFELPSNLIMEKVGARLWIARIMTCLRLSGRHLFQRLIGSAASEQGRKTHFRWIAGPRRPCPCILP